MFPGENMNCKAIANLAAALLMAAFAGASMAQAQTTFKTYRCADGTEFIVGFFQYDKRAHMQVDGKAVTLLKRLESESARSRPASRHEKGPKHRCFDPFLPCVSRLISHARRR